MLPTAALIALIATLPAGDDRWEGDPGDYARLFASPLDHTTATAAAYTLTAHARGFTLTENANGATLGFNGPGADLWAREAFAMIVLRQDGFDLDTWATQFQDERWRKPRRVASL